MGFPVEGFPPEICKQYVNEMIQTGHVRGRRRGSFSFGQYTDDSQLARELLQSYIACKRFDPHDYTNHFAAIFSEGRIVGRGQATSEAAWWLAHGVPWEEAGIPPPSAGNGSAMRAGPIGLLFFDDPEQLLRAVHDQGRVTHQDRRCSAGAIIIAGAVALALLDGPIETAHFLSQLGEWAQTIEHSVADSIQQLIGWIPLPPDEAVIPISKAG